jgi:hypothetical protein
VSASDAVAVVPLDPRRPKPIIGDQRLASLIAAGADLRELLGTAAAS